MYEEKDSEGRVWTAVDEMASEHETGDLLYGLIRMAKPKHAIETGTYKWNAAHQMIMALTFNRRGFLDTCDIVERTQLDIGTIGEYHEFHNMKGVDMIPMVAENNPIDFAFLDSGDDRKAEAVVLYDHLANDSIVVIHDTEREREIEAMEYLVQSARAYQVLEFHTPRGIGILRLLK